MEQRTREWNKNGTNIFSTQKSPLERNKDISSYEPMRLLENTEHEMEQMEQTWQSPIKLKTMRSLIALLIIIILFNACQKQERLLPTVTETNKINVDIFAIFSDVIRPGNPKNPYDSAGIMHNILLGAVQQYILSTSDTCTTSIQNYVTNVHRNSKNYDTELLLKLTPTFQNGLLRNHDPGEITMPIPALTTGYVTALWTVLDGRYRLDYSKIKSGIVSIENKILLDNSLPRDDKRGLLSLTSIARYSTYFWIGQANGAGASPVLMRGLPDPAVLSAAITFMWYADNMAMLTCYLNGLFQSASEEVIIDIVTTVSAMAFVMVLYGW